jgi:hypothetical protein
VPGSQGNELAGSSEAPFSSKSTPEHANPTTPVLKNEDILEKASYQGQFLKFYLEQNSRWPLFAIEACKPSREVRARWDHFLNVNANLLNVFIIGILDYIPNDSQQSVNEAKCYELVIPFGHQFRKREED